jgi:GT2 family glycosyltransferase/peptidoglycan/xylan/chitin deacetylase (PgdA/CDA1 family)
VTGAPDDAMRHSVVVPTFQRRDLVTEVVRALAAQVLPPIEVVVVVDGSTDGSAQALATVPAPFPVRVVEQPNSGAARARNRGAALASGDLLLFLDDDMIAAPDLLAELGRVHAAGADAVLGHIPAVAGSTAAFLTRGLTEWAVRRRDRLVRDGAPLTATDVLTGQLSVRRDVFEALGGFDERFTKDGSFGGEDTDFGRRLLGEGYRVEFAPDAVSHQRYAVTPRAYLRQWHQAGAAAVTYLRKHPDDVEEVYAAKRPHSRSNRLVVRPLAAVPLVRDAAAAVSREVALALAARRPDARSTSRLFFTVRNLEYWRGVAAAGGMPSARPFRVLCYHAVSDLRGTRLAEYGVPAPVLARQLRLLRRLGFRFLAPEEALRSLRGDRGVPRRGVLLTFDDCYADLLDGGLPVLRDLGVPALAFAVADLVGRTNVWDQAIGAPELPLLDARGLRELQRSGVEIGVHGSTHEPLTKVSEEPLLLDRQTRGATATLCGLGLRPVRTFAYPHGEHDARSRAAVAAAGLEAAFTVTAGLAHPGGSPFQVPRIEIRRRDSSMLRFLVTVYAAGRLPLPESRRLRRAASRRLGRLRRRLSS